MTVVKLSASGKQFQVFDDDGNVFVTSITFLNSLLAGSSRKNFLLLSRLPDRVSTSRFKKSPVWYPSGYKESVVGGSVVDDSLSKRVLDSKKEERMFKDESVW